MSGEQLTMRVQLMMKPSEVQAVDDWSFDNRVRGRSEAIRRLIELGLALATPRPSKRAPLSDKA